jgi:hypothetical protein
VYLSGAFEYYTSSGPITNNSGLTEIFGSSLGPGSCP